jgi:hypothetical protein
MSCYHGCYHISETTLMPDSLRLPNSLLHMLGAGIEPAWNCTFQGILSRPSPPNRRQQRGICNPSEGMERNRRESGRYHFGDHGCTPRQRTPRSSPLSYSLNLQSAGECDTYRFFPRNAPEWMPSDVRSASVGPTPTNCQQEPPYPDHKTAVLSIRYPDLTHHLPNRLCSIREPHAISDCGWFSQ